MVRTEKQKQSLYFPEEMLREIARESNRLDRSLSWTVQQAWRLARAEVRAFPGGDPRAAAAGVAPASPRVLERERDRDLDVDNLRPSAQVLQFLRGKFDRELAG